MSIQPILKNGIRITVNVIYHPDAKAHIITQNLKNVATGEYLAITHTLTVITSGVAHPLDDLPDVVKFHSDLDLADAIVTLRDHAHNIGAEFNVIYQRTSSLGGFLWEASYIGADTPEIVQWCESFEDQETK